MNLEKCGYIVIDFSTRTLGQRLELGVKPVKVELSHQDDTVNAHLPLLCKHRPGLSLKKKLLAVTFLWPIGFFGFFGF